MTTRKLFELIERLPPEKKAEVENFVMSLTDEETGSPDADLARLVEQINADRDALLKEHGPFQTDDILRDLREHGGR